jgi:putative transposase
LCRKHGVSDATFYNWRSKFGGMEVSEAKRLKQLEDEIEVQVRGRRS